MYERYGLDFVCRILTIVGIAAKGAMREIARRFEMPPVEINALSKAMPGLVRGRATSLADAPALSPDFKAKIDKDPQVKKIYDIALVIENMAKSTGTHAAGIILSDDKPLFEHVGQMIDKKGNRTSSDDMKVLENLGFIKFDFLGLKTLSIIEDTVVRIYKNHNIKIDTDMIDIEDPLVFKHIFNAGKLAGIFQLSGSSGFKQVTMQFQPKITD